MLLTRYHLTYLYIYICSYAFFVCPFVQLRLHINVQSYWHSNIIPDEMPVCEHWNFCFDCKDWSLHSTSIWLLSPYKTLGSASLIAAPCEPDRPTWDSDNAPRKDVFCSCFHGAFWIFQIDFGETIVLRSLGHRHRSWSLGLLAVWHSEPGQACESFQSWGPGMTTLRILEPLGLGLLWRATLTWNLRKQINRNL